MGNSKFNVSGAGTLLFPDFLRAQNMVQVTEGKITVNVWRKPWEIDFASSLRKVRVSEGLSYRESTVIKQHKTKHAHH